MMLFLKKAFMSIDMNLISFRCPTHIYRSNSCPLGLGGYSFEGFAWRLELQEQYRFHASYKLCKFIASIITPWIDMTSKCLQVEDCILSMAYSTMSVRWLKQTFFFRSRQRSNRGNHLSRNFMKTHQSFNSPQHQGILLVIPQKRK
jgi:hypothetical protein